MPTPGANRRSARGAVRLLLACALSACGGDPQGPGTPPPGSYAPIAVGDTVTAILPADMDTSRYSFRVTQSGRLALFAIANAAMRLDVVDSAPGGTPGNLPIAVVYPQAAEGDELLTRRSERFDVEPGRTYVVRAAHQFTSTTARFRMFLYPIAPAPEHRTAAFAPGDTVVGETIDNSADVDEFPLALSAGTELIAFVQGDDSLPPETLGLTVLRPDGSAIVGVANDTVRELQARATGRFVVEADGTYRFAVQGLNAYPGARPSTGGYRFQVLPINRAPETGPATVAIGDTTSGALEHQGDIDEYTITGTPGQEFNLFFQSTGGPMFGVFEGIEFNGDGPRSIETTGGDTSLYARASRIGVVPASGSFTLRISSWNDQYGTYRGGYRFYPYPINHAPESGPTTLTLGDSVEGTLELPGDVDEFQFTVPSTRLVNLIIESPTGGGPIDLTRYDVTGVLIQGGQRVWGDGSGFASSATGPFQLAQSVYRLLVSSGSEAGSFRGPYRIATYAIDSMPETAPSTVTYEVPVTGESVSPPGDYDVYSFAGEKGDVLAGWLLPTGGSSQFALGMGIYEPGAFQPMAGVSQIFGGDSVPTSPFILPADATYRILVGGNGSQAGTTGDYRFTLHRLGTQPEHVSAAIAPGANVTAESLDQPGDVDEFVLSAPAGTEQQILFTGLPQTRVMLEADQPVSYDVLRSTESFGFRQATGRFVMPAGGQVRIRVFQVGLGSATGSYTFQVIQVERTPEHVPAALTRGVTVQGESIDYPGDVDELTFTGTAGETITAFLQTPQGFPGGPAVLEVVEPGTGNVLGSATSGNPSPGAHGASTGAITLGASGTYRVRVRGQQDTDGTGAIEVFVQ